MLLTLACLKRYFLTVLQRLSGFVQHYQGQKFLPKLSLAKSSVPSIYIVVLICKLTFLGGQIITSGYGIADIRRRSSALLDSKCSEILEICCRHPDWRDVPLETYVEIENPPAVCEEDFYNNDNYEYEDSTCIKVKACFF